MATMRVVQVSRPNGPFEIVERQIPEPVPGTVRIKVHACGICHSDSLTKEGLFPGIQYPRVPGHEVAGVIDAVGAGVAGWKPGQRVGVGWNGGYCGHCDHCRRGDFFACVTGQVTGITYDGGYGNTGMAPAEQEDAERGWQTPHGDASHRVRRRWRVTASKSERTREPSGDGAASGPPSVAGTLLS